MMFEDNMSKLEEPQHTKRRLPLILLMAVLVLAVVGGGGVLAWQLLAQPGLTSNGSPSGGPAAQATQATTGSQQGKGTPPPVAAEVRQQMAQQFQLSVSQLQAQLRAGTPIETLATRVGLSQDQWHTFALDTYQTAYDHAVSAGEVTQQRADHDMQNIRHYPLSALDEWVTGDCLGTSS